MSHTDAIVAIVAKYCGASAEIHLDRSLVFDLGIDGDDANELLEELVAEYPVDLSGLNLGQYFHSEGELSHPLYLLKSLSYRLGLRASPPLRGLPKLTVGNLVEIFSKTAT